MGLSLGAYLSQPVTEKHSANEENDTIVYGVSSMQGWRDTQEDAHNCILDYDTGTSFFAVYDGHGGNEVSEYTSQHLPNFIKENEYYRKGDFENALKDSFVKFDCTLKEPEVVKILQKLAKYNECNDDSESEDENLGNLKAEAQMPIEEVMAKYVANHKEENKSNSEENDSSDKVSGSNSVQCSDVGVNETECSSSKSQTSFNESDSEVSSSSSSGTIPRKCLSEVYNNNVDVGKNKTVDSTSNGSEENREDCSNDKKNISLNSESTASKSEAEEKSGESETGEREKEVSCNGSQVEEAISSSVENGEVDGVQKSKKGKALVKHQQKAVEKKEVESSEKLFQKFIQSDSNEESESESDDATFNGPENRSDDDDDEEENEEAEGEEAEEKEEEGEEEEEEEENEDDEEDDDSEDYEYENEKCFLEPGSDSGCTALVALLKDNKLYVANAGDCRCVVSKNGEAIEMSLDHKPENDIELKRIEKAGGRVNAGRVNDGLNLSRALGDHCYKRTAGLPPEEQMISPLPDIQTLDVDPEVEFMVLACDGIWNSMSSKEVVDFVRPRLEKRTENVAKICEEMFEHCLAPDTLCDGTGCDNMTAIIVQFKKSKFSASRKRHIEDSETEDSAKKQKTEDVTSTDSVDSSQPREPHSEKASNSPDTTQ